MDSTTPLLFLLFIFVSTTLIAFRGLRKRMIKWRALSDDNKRKLRQSHLLSVAGFILAEIFVLGLILIFLPKLGVTTIPVS